MAFSTCAFASPSGNEISSEWRNEVKINRLTAAAFAASTRCNCPTWSTDSIESPACRDKVEDAVEITASTPRQATASEPGSFRSPTQTSTPHLRRHSTLSAELVSRMSPLTFSPRLASLWQISLPTKPGAPTTRIISFLLKEYSLHPLSDRAMEICWLKQPRQGV